MDTDHSEYSNGIAYQTNKYSIKFTLNKVNLNITNIKIFYL